MDHRDSSLGRVVNATKDLRGQDSSSCKVVHPTEDLRGIDRRDSSLCRGDGHRSRAKPSTLTDSGFTFGSEVGDREGRKTFARLQTRRANFEKASTIARLRTRRANTQKDSNLARLQRRRTDVRNALIFAELQRRAANIRPARLCGIQELKGNWLHHRKPLRHSQSRVAQYQRTYS